MRVVIEYEPATEDIKVSCSNNIGVRFLLRILNDAHNAVTINAKEHRQILAVDATALPAGPNNGHNLRGVK